MWLKQLPDQHFLAGKLATQETQEERLGVCARKISVMA